MAIAIKPLRKFSSGTPTTSDMVEGELAVNTADQKIWVRDASNNIVEVGNVSGGGGTPTDITVADESSDTTCFPLFVTAATGDLEPKSGSNLAFNSSSGLLTATGFSGPITGAVTGNADTATTSTNVTVADESSDTTCFPLFATAATGNLPPKSGTNLAFNSSSGLLTATGITADLTGTFGVDLGSDAEGDTYYRDSSGNFVRLAKGTDNYILKMNGNVPNWEAESGGTPTDITVADESSDTTCFPLFVTAVTGDLAPKTGTNLAFNSSSGLLTATGFSGNLTGTLQTAAQGTVTSLGTLTALLIADGAYIGSATTTNAIKIESNGDVKIQGAGDMYIRDDAFIGFGDAADVQLSYDENTSDCLLIRQAVNEADLGIIFAADQAVDAGDEWKFNFANGGVLTLGNDINSAGTHVTHLTITPHATVASSTLAAAGNITSGGTYTGAGLMTTGGNIVLPDDGTIGSNSDADAIAISSAGVVALSATTASTNSTTGALTVAGGAGIAADLGVGDDLRMISDAAVISFGADSDVTLTHVHNTGLLLNSTMAIQFSDASQYINAPSATVLDINATDEVEVNATLMDVNANLDVSGTYTGGGLMTTGGNIVLPDNGTIGSATLTDLMTFEDQGIIIKGTSTSDTDPILELQSTDASANSSPDLALYRNSASPANNDYTGKIVFHGNNDAAERTNFATLTARTLNVANGSEKGTLIISAPSAGVDVVWYLNNYAGSFQLPNNGYIGSAGTGNAIKLDSAGVATFISIPVFEAGINVSGGTIAGTLATAAQANITSLGTLTGLVIADNGTIGSATLTDLMTFEDQGIIIKGTSTSDTDPILELQSTDTATYSSPDLALYRNSASPADNDFTGKVVFHGNNDAAERTNFSAIYGKSLDVSNGTEDGSLFVTCISNGVNLIWYFNLIAAGFTIPDDGYIGTLSDADAIRIAAAGAVTFSQIPVFSAGITGTTSTTNADADFVLIDDAGVTKKITPTNLGLGDGSGLITTGKAIAMAMVFG